jgi:adenosylcobinamide kinase/adenosylcobinamide-phosphate guanylyltransferase
MGKLILLLGGARSGKSTYAEKLAAEIGGDDVLYVATAEVKDEEMAERARKHRASRPASWRTLEAPRGIGAALPAAAEGARAVIVDCITVLSSNVLVAATGDYEDAFAEPKDPHNPAIEAALLAEIEALIAAAQALPVTTIIVSNEAGMGVVPPYELGRVWRDMLGRANQVLAHHADEVYLLVAGIPMTIKGSGSAQ